MHILMFLVLAPLQFVFGVGTAAASPMAGAARAASTVRPIAAPLPGAALNVPLIAPSALPSGSILTAPALTPMLSPAITPVLQPVLRTGPGLPQAQAVRPAVLPKKARAVNPVRSMLQKAVGTFTPAKKGSTARGDADSSVMRRLFDGALKLGGMNLAVRPPDWNEDRRINAAIEKLNQSGIGRDIYAYVYENHSDLTIKVDDDRRADYDARLTSRRGKKVLYLTEALVDRDSPEMIAAFMAREFSELYLESFPDSAEKLYMAYGNMTRVFAELTDSGLSRYGYWWDHTKDRREEGAYAMERYFGSWKEAVTEDHYGSNRLRDSSFFRWLMDMDKPEKDWRYDIPLRSQYRSGHISYSQYREMTDYFQGYVDSEVQWLNETGRW